jgi:hypothetical protein
LLVKKGEVVAVRKGGAEVKAPFDGYVLLPQKPEISTPGHEWFYFGVEYEE